MRQFLTENLVRLCRKILNLSGKSENKATLDFHYSSHLFIAIYCYFLLIINYFFKQLMCKHTLPVTSLDREAP